MKRTLFLLVLFSLNITFSQTINHVVTNKKGKPMLLGKINKTGLTQKPFNDWFNKYHNNYIVNKDLVNTFKDSLKNYTIKAFLGTWCGDSKREIPAFYKILETANFPENQLEVIGVNRTPDAYKKAPNGEEKDLAIHRVPTFIFYKNGKEVNRIVEYPKQTLERDIEKIVTNKPYYSNYYIANLMFNKLNNNTLEAIKKDESYYLKTFPEYSKGSKELNTLGYWFLNDKQYNKAFYVFKLNTKLYKNSANTYDSLAEAYLIKKDTTNALKNYYKVLSLNPEDKNAPEIIDKIKKKLDEKN